MNDGLAVRINEPLARHTALRTGGRCEAWVVVHREASLAPMIADCRQAGWKWTVLGAGTRTIVRDGPVSGVVFRLGTDFARLDAVDGGFLAGAAVPVPAVVAAARAAGLTGIEAFADVQGSFGASLALDSGWADWVTSVRFLHRGKVREAPLDEVQGRKRILLGAQLLLAQGESRRIGKAVSKQIASSPPGSWYVPPKRRNLRKVFRSVQLPMVRLRRVAIPDAAPETLVNLGGGTAADLALLHKSASDRVKKSRGLDLDSRLKWIGARVAPSSP